MSEHCGCEALLNGSAFLKMHRANCRYPVLLAQVTKLRAFARKCIAEQYEGGQITSYVCIGCSVRARTNERLVHMPGCVVDEAIRAELGTDGIGA